MMRCAQCQHFIKTYEHEGWCSHPKYSGLVMFSAGYELCRGNGYVRGSEPPPLLPSDSVETPHTP
jgi:hypothetical protein